MGALAAAMAVAWAGVNLVDDELVQPSPAATATANFRLGTDADELAAIPFATQDMAVPGTASTRAVQADPIAAAASAAGSATDPPPDDTDTPTDNEALASPAVNPVPAAAPVSSAPPATLEPTTVPVATAPATTSPPSSQTLTFNLDGGSAAISFSPNAVLLVWASSNPNYEVSVEPGETLTVEFESETHESKIEVWWDDGPKVRIEEENDKRARGRPPSDSAPSEDARP